MRGRNKKGYKLQLSLEESDTGDRFDEQSYKCERATISWKCIEMIGNETRMSGQRPRKSKDFKLKTATNTKNTILLSST